MARLGVTVRAEADVRMAETVVRPTGGIDDTADDAPADVAPGDDAPADNVPADDAHVDMEGRRS